METLFDWAGNYTAPAVVLLAFGSALTFFMKIVTERAISSQFDRYTKEISLRLERRSRFEETVLLDRYKLIHDLETRIGKIASNLNRMQHGIEVPGFIVKGDIVPLTEVFEELAANRYLLTERFHRILWDQSQILIDLANEKEATAVGELENEYLRILGDFYTTMNEVFGIDKITWERL